MQRIGVIPRNRLQNIPPNLRARHEYCFFLHDQCVHMLKEYAERKADLVTIKFQSDITAKQFQEIADAEDPIEALRKTGYPEEAKRVILNQITMAMVSDCLHHIFEALKCFEKRKIVVALNLLRKPLKDNLTYLAWMLGDEEGFYSEFMMGDPERLTQKRLGNARVEILSKAIVKTKLDSMIDASVLNALLFDRKSANGLEGLFQHAVHLITVQHIELRTLPQNFNFIFANPEDDDIYWAVFNSLPYILLFLSHVSAGLFNRMRIMDEGAHNAFYLRSVYGLCLIEDKGEVQSLLHEILAQNVTCKTCGSNLKVTRYNAVRIVMTESFRCTSCKQANAFPFSWLF